MQHFLFILFLLLLSNTIRPRHSKTPSHHLAQGIPLDKIFIDKINQGWQERKACFHGYIRCRLAVFLLSPSRIYSSCSRSFLYSFVRLLLLVFFGKERRKKILFLLKQVFVIHPEDQQFASPFKYKKKR